MYLLGFLSYFLAVWAMYTPAIKNHEHYIIGSMIFGFCMSFSWPYIVKHTNDPNLLYTRGLIWDAMLVGCFTVLPLFFGVKLGLTAWIGVALVVLGLIIMKL